ncbi:dioxygenase [Vibrio kyushuensis]|uniref:DODA-type extradiol aromatic ring-opening family dioxygenase n=1 Tax=Vibrio kyushuensis TaxID=2910249 RepID=UPI003D125551
MNTNKQPAYFISHGSPMLAIDNSETALFLQSLGQSISKPKAIVVFSAHLDTQESITITSAKNPTLIYDFYGFPAPLYDIQYPAPGDPKLAQRIDSMIREKGLSSNLDSQLGWDHGVWMPLNLMFPLADVPVVQVSISSALGPEVNYLLGQALAPLRNEGVMLIGSGGISHNLRELSSTRPTPNREGKMKEFTSWIETKLSEGDHPSLLNYLDDAPYTLFNHPTQEHFLPLLAVLGSTLDETDSSEKVANSSDKVQRLHSGVQHEILAMDAYQFG